MPFRGRFPVGRAREAWQIAHHTKHRLARDFPARANFQTGENSSMPDATTARPPAIKSRIGAI